MKPLKQRLENVGKKLAEVHMAENPKEHGVSHSYSLIRGFSALSGIVEGLAKVCEDYKHLSLEKGGSHYSSAAEALAKLDAFLDKAEVGK